MKAMKKLKVFYSLLLLPFLVPLSACDSEGEKNISYLNFGMLYDTSLDSENSSKFVDHSISLNYGDLVSKINNKESFLLLVYDKGNTCTCWYRYEATLLRAMKAKNLLIYGIDPKEFEGGKETYGIKYSSSEENLVIFQEGNILAQKSTNGTDDPFVEYENFTNWLDQRIKRSDMLQINKKQLDSLFEESGTSSFLVYFGRESCGDCSYIDKNFLYTYNKEERNTSYYLDCDAVGIRFENESDKKEGKVGSIWQDFKDNYGLSEKYNDELGYGLGYVPSFILYNKGKKEDRKANLVRDMVVTFNDEVKEENGKYLLSDSFYSETHIQNSEALSSLKEKGMDLLLKGKEIDSSEIESYPGGYLAWKKEAALQKEKPILEGFLDFYLKKN